MTASVKNINKLPDNKPGFWRRLWEAVIAHRDRKLLALFLAAACTAVFYHGKWKDIGRWRTVSGVSVELLGVKDNVYSNGRMRYYIDQEVSPAKTDLGISVLGGNDSSLGADQFAVQLLLPVELACDAGEDCAKLHAAAPHEMKLPVDINFCRKPEGCKIRTVGDREVVIKWDTLVTREVRVNAVWTPVNWREDREVSLTPVVATVSGPRHVLSDGNFEGKTEAFGIDMSRLGEYEQSVQLISPDPRCHFSDDRVVMHVNVFDPHRHVSRKVSGVRVNYMVSQTELGNLRVTREGLEEGLPDIIDVVVTGPRREVENLSPRDIVAYCDLTGYAQSDATHKVVVQFKLPRSVSIQGGSWPLPRRLTLKWGTPDGESSAGTAASSAPAASAASAAPAASSAGGDGIQAAPEQVRK